MTFGDRLRYLIDRQELKQKELAPLMSIGKSTLSGYVNNSRMPDLEQLVRIAEYFGVTTDYLLGCNSSPENIPLSTAERELLTNLRSLDKEQQEIIFKLAEMLTKKI